MDEKNVKAILLARVMLNNAMKQGSQERYDLAAAAAAWAIMEPKRNRYLAELAVETTGLGNVPDKIIKNHRKTQGVMSLLCSCDFRYTFDDFLQQASLKLLGQKG